MADNTEFTIDAKFVQGIITDGTKVQTQENAALITPKQGHDFVKAIATEYEISPSEAFIALSVIF